MDERAIEHARMINCRKIRCDSHAYYRMALGLSTPAGLAEKVDVLIDFRAPEDAVTQCDRAARCINIPMTGVGGRYRNTKLPTRADLLAFYIELVDAYRTGYAQLAQTVFSGALVAFGCYFGKDRTGIASYLLGACGGVPLEQIINDYCRSGPELERNIDAFPDHWSGKGLTKEEYVRRLSCSRETIPELHRYIVSSYGSVRDYLCCADVAAVVGG